MDCKNCNAEKATRFSDESMSEKLLRIIKWIIIACAIFAVLNNAVWLYVWQLYDYTGDKTVTVDGKEGIAGYVEGDGRMLINGESDGETYELQTP